MSKQISELLKEATNGLLNEKTLNEIQTAFDSAVTERVKIHVEKALVEQDSQYTEKLEQLLEAVNVDHTEKLKKVVRAIDANNASKLQTVVKRYSRAINEQAKSFKNEMVDSVSRYLNLYLNKAVPTNTLNEAVYNRKAAIVLENLRKTLAIDTALMKESLRSAIIDGQKQISEKTSELTALKKETQVLKESAEKAKSALILEQKISNLPEKKRAYAKRVLEGKSVKFIQDNIDYTLSLFDKKEEDRLDALKEEAFEARTVKSDRVVLEESVDVQQQQHEEPTTPFLNSYMSELGRY
jgi:hypothetical protein